MILEIELTSGNIEQIDCIGVCAYYASVDEVTYAFNYLDCGMDDGKKFLEIDNMHIADKDIKKVRYQYGKGLMGFLDEAVESNLEWTGSLSKKMVLI